MSQVSQHIKNHYCHCHLLLLSELCFHLFAARLVLPNAMSSYKVATDISQLWILLASFLYQSKEVRDMELNTSKKNILTFEFYYFPFFYF